MNHLLLTGGQETLGIFGITPIGIALVLLAIVYMSLGRWILPKRKARADEADYLRLDRYYTELIVEPKSRWIGQPMADFNRYYDGRLEVVEWLRDGVPQHNKNRGSVLAEGDVLFVSATPDEIVSVESEPGLALHAVKKYGEVERARVRRGAAARAGGRRAAFAVHRRDHRGRRFPARPSTSWSSACGGASPGSATGCRRCSCREGDLLVLRGTPDRFAELAAHHGFLMMVPFSGRPRRRQHAVRAHADRGRRRARRPLRASCRRRWRSWAARSRWS